VRVIAIFDYWSQAALRPLHLFIINRLPLWFKACDMTLNQQSYRLRLPEVVDKFKYSFDLSAATDRFPVELQEYVLSLLISSKYAESWKFLMIGLPFRLRSALLLKFYPDLRDCDIEYKGGQPMGAYSSWAVFALTHHLVIKSCGLDLDEQDASTYFLLGDDV